MGAFKDTYDIIKDLLKAAKNVQNQEVVQLAMDLQEKFFELREDNDKILQENKKLETKIAELSQKKIIENDIEISTEGYITLKNNSPKVLYCGCCWGQEHKLIPLSRISSNTFQCGHCKVYVRYDKR